VFEHEQEVFEKGAVVLCADRYLEDNSDEDKEGDSTDESGRENRRLNIAGRTGRVRK